jgi:hypothetical protein
MDNDTDNILDDPPEYSAWWRYEVNKDAAHKVRFEKVTIIPNEPGVHLAPDGRRTYQVFINSTVDGRQTSQTFTSARPHRAIAHVFEVFEREGHDGWLIDTADLMMDGEEQLPF